MGSFSDAFFERGVDKGVANSIETLMKKMNLSATEAMDLLEIPKAKQQKYLDMLDPQCTN